MEACGGDCGSGREFAQLPVLLVRQVFAVLGVLEVHFDFQQRRARVLEELRKLARVEALESLTP